MEGFTPDITDFNLLKFERVGYWSFLASSFFYFGGVVVTTLHKRTFNYGCKYWCFIFASQNCEAKK